MKKAKKNAEEGGVMAKIKIAEVSFSIRLTSECLDLISRIPDVHKEKKRKINLVLICVTIEMSLEITID